MRVGVVVLVAVGLALMAGGSGRAGPGVGAQSLFPNHLTTQAYLQQNAMRRSIADEEWLPDGNGTTTGKKKPYITSNHMVKMRDGTRLHTIVFNPIEAENKHKAAVLMRTPYGATGLKGLGEFWVDQGYVAVMQDFRGRYKSEGKFACWFNATVDGADTIHWIKKQSWSNNRVFAQGVSANGIAAYLEEADPTLVGTLLAQYVVVATAEVHRTIFQGGAYRYSLLHGWLDGLKEGSFEHNFVDNEAFGSFYSPVSMTDKWKDITAPAVHLTGWYDIFNHEQLRAYNAYQTQSTVGKGLNFLVVVPTGHCAGGQVSWPKGVDGVAVAEALAATMFKALAVAADEHDDMQRRYGLTCAPLSCVQAIHARARDLLRRTNAPVVQYYVMGPNGASGPPGRGSGPFGNYWAEADALPIGKETSFFFNGTSQLLLSDTPSTEASVSYVYDPEDPVPTIGGNNLLLSQCGPWDQSVLEKRADVVSFTSQPLTNHMVVSGEMRAHIFVSTNCTDTDVTVKVLDVYPNGTSMLLQDGIVRMRWANDSRAPHLLTPDNVYMAEVSVWNTAYVFNTGHRIRVDVSSSNFPRFSANPNTGKPLSSKSTQTTLAHNTIFTGPAYPSKLILPLVSEDEMPIPSDIDNLRRRLDEFVPSRSSTTD